MNRRKKRILILSLILASVILYMYCRQYMDYHEGTNINDVIRISKPPGQMKNITPNHTSDPLNVVKIRKEAHNFVKGVLRFDSRSVDMFLHGKHDLISQQILKDGMWEGHWINQLITYLKAHPGMQLIDAGCNLGVFTLVAATLGHKVIAIDANKNNTDRLAQSVLVNNLTDRVTIVLNALSDERKTFSMNREVGNIGGQYLLDNQNDPYQVRSIFLDDLLPLLDTKKDVMMKMIIQSHEVRAMKAASNLFAMTNIKLILIEWVGEKEISECYTLMRFLLCRNYAAYTDFYSKMELTRSNYRACPYEITWKRH